MEEEIEIWKDVDGYDGFYQVSNMGNVKSLKKTLTQSLTSKGYLRVSLITVENKSYKLYT
jgi:hypothetical protein